MGLLQEAGLFLIWALIGFACSHCICIERAKCEFTLFSSDGPERRTHSDQCCQGNLAMTWEPCLPHMFAAFGGALPKTFPPLLYLHFVSSSLGFLAPRLAPGKWLHQLERFYVYPLGGRLLL